MVSILKEPQFVIMSIYLSDLMKNVVSSLSSGAALDAVIQDHLKTAMMPPSPDTNQSLTSPVFQLEKSLLSLAAVTCTKGIFYTMTMDLTHGDVEYTYIRYVHYFFTCFIL